MMRVAIYHNVLWSKYKGVVFGELHALALKRGDDFHFTQIASTGSDRASLNDVDLNYHRYPYDLLFAGFYDKIPKWRLIGRLVSGIFKQRYDLIVLPGYNTVEYWCMLAACVVRRQRVAVFCDSTINDRVQSMTRGVLKRIFFQLCDGYFAYGRRSADYLAAYGANPSKIFARCQAAALSLGYSAESAKNARLLNFPGVKNPKVLFVGRLSDEKNIVDLINAFSSIYSANSGARLEIVGSGPKRAYLDGLIRELGISKAVVFRGGLGLDDVVLAMQCANCVVLPSSSEPWGLVVNEALHYGCPVVVSDACGCVPELVIDGVTGYSFQTGNTVELAEKIEKAIYVLGRDPGRVADRCIDHIARFTPEVAAEQIYHGCKMISRRA
jgi:glycosyltransferase involved in cell wall biosynthesis